MKIQPVVSSCNSPTENISQFLDHWLQDYNHGENGNEGNQEDLGKRGDLDIQELCIQVGSVHENVEEKTLSHAEQSANCGYTLTMNNIYRPECQTEFRGCDRSTLSYHFTHVFAAQNCVNSLGQQDGF